MAYLGRGEWAGRGVAHDDAVGWTGHGVPWTWSPYGPHRTGCPALDQPPTPPGMGHRVDGRPVPGSACDAAAPGSA